MAFQNEPKKKMKSNLNIERADFGNIFILQYGPTFIGLNPSDEGVKDLTFRIWHMGRMAGSGYVEGSKVRFEHGEEMPNGLGRLVAQMIQQEFPTLFEPETSAEDPMLNSMVA